MIDEKILMFRAMTRLIAPVLAGAFALSATASVAQEEAAPDLLKLVEGNWRVVRDDGTVSQDCDKAQHFVTSTDRQHIELTEPWASPTFAAKYRLILIDGTRMLTYIEGEDRKTDQGDPVLWWFYFSDPDHFRFRRYDWAEYNATQAQWERCSSPNPG